MAISTAPYRCLRCDRAIRTASLMVAKRPVCASCAPHLSEWCECSRCQELARRHRMKRVAGALVCQTCSPDRSKATCSVCHRHRRIAGQRDGKNICAACVRGETHECPTCGVTVPGNGSCRCRACSNRDRALTLANVLVERFEQQWVRVHWMAFVRWGTSKKDAYRFGSSLFHQSDAWAKIDKHLVDDSSLTAEGLVALFPSGMLRRYVTVTEYLQDVTSIDLGSHMRNEATELRRAKSIIKKCSAPEHRQILESYRVWLCDGDRPVSALTSRLYLSAAYSYLKSSQTPIQNASEQSARTYLKSHSGHRASLFRFFTFLREQKISPNAVMPKRSARYRSGYTDDVLARVRAIHDALDGDLSGPRFRALIAALISLYYGIPLSHSVKLQVKSIDVSRMRLRYRDEGVPIVEELQPHLKRLTEMAGGSGSLFPGRLPQDTLSPSAVSYHMRQTIGEQLSG